MKFTQKAQQVFSLLAKEEKRRLFYMLIPMTITAIINVVGVAVIVPFIAVCANPNSIFQHKQLHVVYQYFGFSSTSHFLIMLGFLVLVVLFVSNGFAILTSYVSSKILGNIQKSLGKRFITQCLSQPYTFFLSKNSSVVATDLTNTVGLFVEGYLFNVMSFISVSLSMLFLAGALFYFRPVISAVVFLVFFMAFVGIYAFVRKKLSLYQKNAVFHMNAARKFASESIQGIKNHKIYHSEPFYIKGYIHNQKHVIQESVFTRVMGSVPRNALEIIAFGMVVGIALYLLMEDKSFVSIMPTLALFAFSGYRILPAMQQLFQFFSSAKIRFGTVKQLHNYFDSFVMPVATTTENINLDENFDEIKIDKVTFHYPGCIESTLKNISMTIKRNQTIGIVGTTGAGKTTIIDIILGLLRPSEGQLVVGGKSISGGNIYSWQSHLGYVPQHIYLSDDDVISNIAFGIPREKIDFDAVVKAATIANIHDFIVNDLANGYESKIGEQGVQLSGGQRQRIGIARAMYRNPPVLVLDEATSALDQITEKAVMSAIYKLKHKKTIIIIAHRLSTIRLADAVYLIDKGQVKDYGDFDTVMSRNQLQTEEA